MLVSRWGIALSTMQHVFVVRDRGTDSSVIDRVNKALRAGARVEHLAVAAGGQADAVVYFVLNGSPAQLGLDDEKSATR